MCYPASPSPGVFEKAELSEFMNARCNGVDGTFKELRYLAVCEFGIDLEASHHRLLAGGDGLPNGKETIERSVLNHFKSEHQSVFWGKLPAPCC